MSAASIGLLVFIAVTTSNMVALGLDSALLLDGFRTITEFVVARPVLVWAILALEVVGVVGLAVHFLCRG